MKVCRHLNLSIFGKYIFFGKIFAENLLTRKYKIAAQKSQIRKRVNVRLTLKKQYWWPNLGTLSAAMENILIVSIYVVVYKSKETKRICQRNHDTWRKMLKF